MTSLDSILKSRDIALPTKVRLVKAMVFPVVMYGCESWTIKKAEHRRIDAFELWCWRRLLRVPWTARRSNQSIRQEISPEYSLEGLMPELKLQYFGHLMLRTDSFEKTRMLGKIEGRRRRGWQRMRWHHWFNENEFQQVPGDGEGQGSLVCHSPWGSQRVRHNWATELNFLTGIVKLTQNGNTCSTLVFQMSVDSLLAFCREQSTWYNVFICFDDNSMCSSITHVKNYGNWWINSLNIFLFSKDGWLWKCKW